MSGAVPAARVDARQLRWAAIALAVVTGAVYFQTAGFDFVNYDDPGYVTGNPIVKAGLTASGVAWAFTTDHMANWHPITWLSHMLDCQLFGLSSGAHHLVNVAFHVLDTVLLFLVFARMTRRVWPSALVAALFALHPLHVESVAWVAERKDVLSTFFWLVTMWLYCRYVEVPGPRYLLVLASFTLGLMAKPMLVTLPFVLLLLDFWPLGRIRVENGKWVVPPAAVLDKVPMIVLVGVTSVLTFLVQRRGGTVAQVGMLSVGTRLQNVLVSYVTYLRKTFWPSDLGIPYPLHLPIPETQVAIAAGVLLAITAVVLALHRSRPYLVVGWLWYLGVLVPVIGFVQVGEQAMADRYTYVPLIGIFVMVAWTVADLVRRPALLALAATPVVVACAAASWVQAGYWHDSVTLLEHTLAVTTENEDAHFGLGMAFLERSQVDDAVPHFREAIRLYPEYAAAHTQLGLALEQQDKTDEAIAEYNAALRIDPGLAEAHEYLGMALAEQGNYTEAASHLTAALRLRPGVPKTHYLLGLALAFQGRADEATAHFQETLRLDPTFAQAYYRLGLIWTAHGRPQEAVKAYRDALRLRPDSTDFENELAWTLATNDSPAVRDGGEAVRLAERACDRTDRRDPALLDTLAACYAEVGRFDDAVAVAEQAQTLARERGKSELADEIAVHAGLFREHRPLREPGATMESAR